MAKENCAALIKDGSAVSFVASDYLKAFPTQRFDVIVSNPPYIRQAEMNTLDPEVRSYEPRLALDGGTDGLDAYRRIASEIRPVLEADGHLFLEVGYDQAEEVAKLFAPHFTQTEIIKDLNAIARVVHLYNV